MRRAERAARIGTDGAETPTDVPDLMSQIRVLADSDTSEALLDQLQRFLLDAFDGDFADEDWQHTTGGWRVIVFEGPLPVAHVAVVPRVLWINDRAFRAGYVEGVATTVERQRRGYGSQAMVAATKLIRSSYELGALSTGLHDFYQRFGWERWKGPSFVRAGEELIRTSDEDDGLMVLRLGPSETIDLMGAIACEQRAGDDW
jgi:aminoglycoside 2'-N-acetyltransferase I